MRKMFSLFLLAFIAAGIFACTGIPTTQPTTSTTSEVTTVTTTSTLLPTSNLSTTTLTTTEPSVTTQEPSTTATNQTTTEEIALSFSAMALTGGANDGELVLNISKSSVQGTIYFIIVPEASTAPSANQIIAGVNYGDAVVTSSGNAANFTSYIVTGLDPGARYTMYTVIAHEALRSVIRNLTSTAKLNVVTVDKGEGTLEDPFQISIVEDLEQIGSGYYAADGKEWNMDSHYVLMNDIDLSDKYGQGKLNWPVLGADSAGNRFSGVLDGAGYAIIGLYIGNTSTAGVYRGLFAASEHTAIVRNLTFSGAIVTGAGIDESNSSHGTGVLFGYFKGSVENLIILDATVTDTGTRVGGLAGRSYESGHVRNVYVEAMVRGQNRVGGIAGVVDISDTTANPIVYDNVVFSGEVIGDTQHIGGLVGYLRGIQMSNVYVTGYIQGGRETGGVAGFYQKRAGNNLVAATVQGAIVYATVFGTGSATTIGNIIGQKSTSNITPENESLLQVLDCYFVEGTETFNGGDVNSVMGTLLTKADIATLAWFETNLPGFDFDADWEFKTNAQRPSLVDTPDTGMFGELSTPLVLLPAFTEGPEEAEISVRITANKANTTIYFAVLSSDEVAPSQVELKNPTEITGVLAHGNGALIQSTFSMPEYDTEYHVFYYAEHDDGDSQVLHGVVNSKEMTILSIDGGIRPGDADKEIIVTLTTNLDGMIYYIIVAEAGIYQQADILDPTDVLFSGSGILIDATHVMPAAETTYYLYAVAVLTDRESSIFSASGLSSSDTYVNYGTGTSADPFIIRTIEDLENIGNPSYVNAEDMALSYSDTAYYTLDHDIDLTTKYGEGLLNWTPLPDFSGVFDGGGHKIIGLYLDDLTRVTHSGLFGYLKTGSEVRNLTLENVYINVNGQQSDGNTGMTGALAGRMNSASAHNIRIVGATITAQGYRVGAIAGGNEGTNGHLTNIYVQANVTGFARVGGIIGNISNSSAAAFTLNDFVFSGSVSMIGTADYRVGGVVGWARGFSMENGYVEGTVGGVGAYAGGVAGYLENYNDQTMFSQIKNVLVNVVVISSVNRAGGLIGNVSSTASKVPALINAYQTLQTTMIIPETQHTSVRNGEIADESLFDSAWFSNHMVGWTESILWTFLSEGERPALVNSPDEGLVNPLDIPLVITDQIQTGTAEREIVIKLSTNRPDDQIYYIVTIGGEFTAEAIISAVQADPILFAGNGASIDTAHIMPEYGFSYTVHYVIVSGEENSSVIDKQVASGAETILVMSAEAATGEDEPGDIVITLLSSSHPATFWALVLPEEEIAPDATTIKADGIVLETTLTLSLVPGASYKVYLVGEKIDGSMNGAIVTLDVVAKAEPDAPFSLSVATLEKSDVPGELVLTVQTSHEASVHYWVLLPTDPIPSSMEIVENGILLTESPTILDLIPDTQYCVYIVAERLESSDTDTATLTATTKRQLFNGEQTSSYYPIYALEDLEVYRDGINSGAISNSSTLEFFTDIDMATDYGTEGKNWVPIGDLKAGTIKYKGSVQGNGHIINGLYINRETDSTDKGTGFFGTTDSTLQIIDLHFTNVDVTGTFSVGAVIGYGKATLIQNVSVSGGFVTSTSASDSRVGGLIGRLNTSSSSDSIVEFCWTDVVVVGFKYVGGLVGHADYSTDGSAGELIIRDVYTKGTVSSTLSSSANVGGVVGYLRVTLIRAIAYGTVTNPSTQCGGVVGYIQSRHVTNVTAKAIDIIAANNHDRLIGSVNIDRGEPVITGNLLVVAADPQANQITLAQLLDTDNWGTLVPLSTLTWEVLGDFAVLKQ